ELGSAAIVESHSPALSDIESVVPNDPEVRGAFNDLGAEQRNELAQAASADSPPGLAISYLALVDGLLLFTIGLLGASLILPARTIGRVQGIATLIASILVILIGIILAVLAFVQLLLMVT